MSDSLTVNGPLPARGPHVFVFDNMRTRSHLFWRWVSTHPALYTTYHRYLNAGYLGPDNILPKLRDSEARTIEKEQTIEMFGSDDTYESSNRQLEKDIVNAEIQGKQLFSNEHLIDFVNHYIQMDLVRRGDKALPRFDIEFPNPTYMEDRLLQKFTPVILIRHPVLQVASLYSSMTAFSQCRPGDENFNLITSHHHARIIFEYFRLSRGCVPIVIDSEDILWRTEELGAKFCHVIGIDPGGLKDKWDRLHESWWSDHPFVYAMTKTIHESTGIERPTEKPEEPNVDRAFQRWSENHGLEIAEQLKERVNLAMPHYEYLVQFKI